VDEQGTSRGIVDRSGTRNHADRGVTRKNVVRERQVPVSKGALLKLHAVSREGNGHSRETYVRGQCATSRVPRQGDSRL